MNEFETNLVYCPECDEIYDYDRFEYLGIVAELGNVPRYRCKKCGRVFETLPPSVAIDKNLWSKADNAGNSKLE